MTLQRPVRTTTTAAIAADGLRKSVREKNGKSIIVSVVSADGRVGKKFHKKLAKREKGPSTVHSTRKTPNNGDFIF